MNILITSAGRRTSLVKIFRSALTDMNGKVYTTDINGLAPALYFSDGSFCTPPVTDENFIEYLLNIVRTHKIRMIIPTIDTELAILAKWQDIFKNEGCHPLISSEEFISITIDKWTTVNTFESKGFKCPKSWIQDNFVNEDLPFNLFIKPRTGSASQDTYAATRSDLKNYLPLVNNFIIQELLDGDEVTVDALIDLDGIPVHYVPRIRIKTLGGESIQGKTISDHDIRDWMVTLLDIISTLGGRGPITIQYFVNSDGPVLTEINPRFGGGFPLSYQAGGKYPEWILRMLRGEKIIPTFGNYKKDLYMTRYFEDYFISKPLW